MNRGVKIRFDVHNILYDIYKFNKVLDNHGIRKKIADNAPKDVSFINNLTLNSMRYQFHSRKIINKYIRKKLKIHEEILLISAITQIVYLDFKEYAVVDCSVEIAKKINMYHGLANSFLKKISRDKKELKKTKITFNDLPNWFLNYSSDLSSRDKKIFIENFYKEPDLHMVFKNSKKLTQFEEKIQKTTDKSGYLLSDKKISDIKSYKKGFWWIQDFSSFFPINNLEWINENDKCLDMCAAPGGKSFQLLSTQAKVTLNDINKSRLKILNENLKRLNFKTKVLNKDYQMLDSKEKYSLIIVDAPCSAIGTIRKNPEIFFKNSEPDINKLLYLQEKLLDKASDLLIENGLIVYMVCSFLKVETLDQINKFIKKYKNFRISNFQTSSQNNYYAEIIKYKFMRTLPNILNGKTIDGYFAAYIRKIK